MAPSNVLSMAQLRTLPLADQIKILMKNGGCPSPTLPGAPVPVAPEEWTLWDSEDQGARPEAPAAHSLLSFAAASMSGKIMQDGSAAGPRRQAWGSRECGTVTRLAPAGGLGFPCHARHLPVVLLGRSLTFRRLRLFFCEKRLMIVPGDQCEESERRLLKYRALQVNMD